MHQVSIVSIGAGVQDVLLSGKIFSPQDEDGTQVEEFKLGGKYEVEHVTFSTGGGATNGAVTFARQGMRSFFMGKIGHDPAGDAVLSDLRKDRVDTSLVMFDSELSTGYSSILISPTGERVVLVHRGASTSFEKKDFKVSRINADWMFITSMGGALDVIEMLINHAKSTHMKVALIPGSGELANPDELRRIVAGVDIFSANKEEVQTLVEGSSIEELALGMSHLSGGITVVTDGPSGVATSDGRRICKAGMYEDVPVVDRLGAGDAFASGFVSVIARGGSMEDAIIFASANSTSVVSTVGAKTGILHKDAQLHGMEIHAWDV